MKLQAGTQLLELLHQLSYKTLDNYSLSYVGKGCQVTFLFSFSFYKMCLCEQESNLFLMYMASQFFFFCHFLKHPGGETKEQTWGEMLSVNYTHGVLCIQGSMPGDRFHTSPKQIQS
jgi:hypothetical protein